MKKYLIAYADDPETLEIKVDNLISQGWIVSGGIGVGIELLYQAMVKEDPSGWTDLAPKKTEKLG